ncbi:MarR family winged helix-turn-helix transcriptional regulator [Ancrocorticia populi]|uniref:MarR family transcriptional regulator n=1 Tax=Ancrocorticia populi TaxID=2175228 RepID=A0A2V1K722_9ACTO|nr:MarR family transcriptional regulator [Ancrocorticia populi]MDN6486508.1 MarR family transcriptional regulator [Ancrocorticia sp.]PWF27258.1 MarR family transcriptional regulator [Ancrocorticia populi]
MHNSEELRDEVDGIVAAWGRERTDFNPEPLSVFSRLLRLDRHIDKMRRQTFAKHGIESWEFEMLAALRRQGKPYRLTAGRLVQETLVSSGTVTNRIDRMVAHGYAERHPDPKDRRVVHVQATEAGVRVVDAAMEDLLTAEQHELEDMPIAEQKELAVLLRQLLAHFER